MLRQGQVLVNDDPRIVYGPREDEMRKVRRAFCLVRLMMFCQYAYYESLYVHDMRKKIVLNQQ